MQIFLTTFGTKQCRNEHTTVVVPDRMFLQFPSHWTLETAQNQGVLQEL
jgi:hypothetical protein